MNEQVKRLRDSAYVYRSAGFTEASRLFLEAADTIEGLSARLAAANMERPEAHHGGGWIACSERLPENFKDPGAFCPKYDVRTKYGDTIGWCNPDLKKWFILIWFMTDRCSAEEIDFERGDVPKVVGVPLDPQIVLAWKDTSHE